MDISNGIPAAVALVIMQLIKKLDKHDKLKQHYGVLAGVLGLGLGGLYAWLVQGQGLEGTITAAFVAYGAAQAAWAVKESTGVKIPGDVGTGVSQ